MGLFYLKWTSGSMVVGKVESTRRESSSCFNLSSLWGGSTHYNKLLQKDRAGVRSCRRGQRVIVATGPAIEAPVIATEPLTKHDLIDYLVSGCKPKEKWRSPTFLKHTICRKSPNTAYYIFLSFSFT